MTADRPIIDHAPPLSISQVVEQHLPDQGGIELQRDRPYKVHSWHSHAVHERLVVLSGHMKLEFIADGEIRDATASAGSQIDLPPGVIHQSTATSTGCHYVIVPEGGKAAVTTEYSDPLTGTVSHG